MASYVTALLLVLCVTVFYSCGLRTRSSDNCPTVPGDIPVKDNFNMTRYTGHWHVVQRTVWLHPRGDFEGLNFIIKKTTTPDVYLVYGSKLITNSSECSNDSSIELLEPRPGVSTHPDKSFYYYISETDYDNLALEYLLKCSPLVTNMTDGCIPEQKDINILSRTTNPDQELVNQYLDMAIDMLCGTKDDFIENVPYTGVCTVPDEAVSD